MSPIRTADQHGHSTATAPSGPYAPRAAIAASRPASSSTSTTSARVTAMRKRSATAHPGRVWRGEDVEAGGDVAGLPAHRQAPGAADRAHREVVRLRSAQAVGRVGLDGDVLVEESRVDGGGHFLSPFAQNLEM